MIQPSPTVHDLLHQARGAFRDWTGTDAQFWAGAPGRINLIGEHTDYNEGWVLPMAIDRYTVVVAALNNSADQINVKSVSAQEQGMISLSQLSHPTETLWLRYVQGVVALYERQGIRCPPLDILVLSSVPVGGGLSSSAALELAMAHLIESVTEQRLLPWQRIRTTQRAEWDFAGVPCGVMDQFISDQGREGFATLLDCQTEALRPIPFSPSELSLLIVHSGVSHALADGAYADRRAQCQAAAKALHLPSLRDADIASLDRLSGEKLLIKRARHVVSENQRVLDAVAALEMNDWACFGRLLTESHVSLRDDFEVSCAEMDLLVDLISGQSGVLGARMIGGGFGGCALALVRRSQVDDVVAAVGPSYHSKTGAQPLFYLARSSAGAEAMVDQR